MFENDLPRRYDEFQPIVADIKAGAGRFVLAGEGVESRVWRVSLATGEYAVKIAKEGALSSRGRPRDPCLMTKQKIMSGLDALGIRGLEQLETGSIEDTAVIYRYVEGINLTQLTENDALKITEDQVAGFLDTVAKATEAGLIFDGNNPSGANAFYDPKEGFTLIDYQQAWWPVSYEENRSFAIQSLGSVALNLFDTQH